MPRGRPAPRSCWPAHCFSPPLAWPSPKSHPKTWSGRRRRTRRGCATSRASPTRRPRHPPLVLGPGLRRVDRPKPALRARPAAGSRRGRRWQPAVDRRRQQNRDLAGPNPEHRPPMEQARLVPARVARGGGPVAKQFFRRRFRTTRCALLHRERRVALRADQQSSAPHRWRSRETSSSLPTPRRIAFRFTI